MFLAMPDAVCHDRAVFRTHKDIYPINCSKADKVELGLVLDFVF